MTTKNGDDNNDNEGTISLYFQQRVVAGTDVVDVRSSSIIRKGDIINGAINSSASAAKELLSHYYYNQNGEKYLSIYVCVQ